MKRRSAPSADRLAKTLQPVRRWFRARGWTPFDFRQNSVFEGPMPDEAGWAEIVLLNKNGARKTLLAPVFHRSTVRTERLYHLFGPRNLHAVGLFGGEETAFQVVSSQVRIGIGRSLGGGPDGELETLDGPVSKLAGPHHVFGSHHRHDAASQRNEVGIASHLDRLRRADLDTRKAFPTLIRLLIVSLHLVGVQDHQVIWTDVHARGLVSALAPIAFFSDDERRHITPPVSGSGPPAGGPGPLPDNSKVGSGLPAVKHKLAV